jgi:ribosome-associated translation inhibitor RaiA
VVRVEEHEDDLYAAVDLVSDKLKRKLVKVRVAGRLAG